MSSGPVIPWIYEVGGYAILFVYAAIVIWALVEVARSATLTPTKRVLWGWLSSFYPLSPPSRG